MRLVLLQMILNSMQKYQPVLKVICETDGMTQCFRFPETTFIAVTAYQNHGVSGIRMQTCPHAQSTHLPHMQAQHEAHCACSHLVDYSAQN